ncbi:hypothetical protein VitviT2T_029099 [Vitis vinifera]|nr:hypothetical protein VitviT2T_029099 [Vitis vinifera]
MGTKFSCNVYFSRPCVASSMGIITKSAMVVALATVDDAGTIHSSNSAVPSASGGDPVHSSSANYFFCSLLVQRVHVPLFNVCSVVHRFGKPQTCKHVIKSCHMEGGFEMRMGCLRDVNVISGLPAAISAGRLDIQDDERHVTRYAFPTWQDVLAVDSKSIENAIRRGSLAVTEVSCIKKMLNCLLGRKCKLCLGYLCDLTVDEIKTELSHFKGIGLKTETRKPALATAMFSAVSFMLGAITSVVSGFLGMKMATYANINAPEQEAENESAGGQRVGL